MADAQPIQKLNDEILILNGAYVLIRSIIMMHPQVIREQGELKAHYLLNVVLQGCPPLQLFYPSQVVLDDSVDKIATYLKTYYESKDRKIIA